MFDDVEVNDSGKPTGPEAELDQATKQEVADLFKLGETAEKEELLERIAEEQIEEAVGKLKELGDDPDQLAQVARFFYQQADAYYKTHQSAFETADHPYENFRKECDSLLEDLFDEAGIEEDIWEKFRFEHEVRSSVGGLSAAFSARLEESDVREAMGIGNAEALKAFGLEERDLEKFPQGFETSLIPKLEDFSEAQTEDLGGLLLVINNLKEKFATGEAMKVFLEGEDRAEKAQFMRSLIILDKYFREGKGKDLPRDKVLRIVTNDKVLLSIRSYETIDSALSFVVQKPEDLAQGIEHEGLKEAVGEHLPEALAQVETLHQRLQRMLENPATLNVPQELQNPEVLRDVVDGAFENIKSRIENKHYVPTAGELKYILMAEIRKNGMRLLGGLKSPGQKGKGPGGSVEGVKAMAETLQKLLKGGQAEKLVEDIFASSGGAELLEEYNTQIYHHFYTEVWKQAYGTENFAQSSEFRTFVAEREGVIPGYENFFENKGVSAQEKKTRALEIAHLLGLSTEDGGINMNHPRSMRDRYVVWVKEEGGTWNYETWLASDKAGLNFVERIYVMLSPFLETLRGLKSAISLKDEDKPETPENIYAQDEAVAQEVFKWQQASLLEQVCSSEDAWGDIDFRLNANGPQINTNWDKLGQAFTAFEAKGHQALAATSAYTTLSGIEPNLLYAIFNGETLEGRTLPVFREAAKKGLVLSVLARLHEIEATEDDPTKLSQNAAGKLVLATSTEEGFSEKVVDWDNQEIAQALGISEVEAVVEAADDEGGNETAAAVVDESEGEAPEHEPRLDELSLEEVKDEAQKHLQAFQEAFPVSDDERNPVTRHVQNRTVEKVVEVLSGLLSKNEPVPSREELQALFAEEMSQEYIRYVGEKLTLEQIEGFDLEASAKTKLIEAKEGLGDLFVAPVAKYRIKKAISEEVAKSFEDAANLPFLDRYTALAEVYQQKISASDGPQVSDTPTAPEGPPLGDAIDDSETPAGGPV